jgi:ABC-type transporter Mla subunit MlaD
MDVFYLRLCWFLVALADQASKQRDDLAASLEQATALMAKQNELIARLMRDLETEAHEHTRQFNEAVALAGRWKALATRED